mmetsp:Transcript_20161/g.42204  ORF Transcript_20161/g.42204 Transcript_20161/m.42204 type:complete len:204 (+) Transcript_20161:1509-2120(+)
MQEAPWNLCGASQGTLCARTSLGMEKDFRFILKKKRYFPGVERVLHNIALAHLLLEVVSSELGLPQLPFRRASGKDWPHHHAAQSAGTRWSHKFSATARHVSSPKLWAKKSNASVFDLPFFPSGHLQLSWTNQSQHKSHRSKWQLPRDCCRPLEPGTCDRYHTILANHFCWPRSRPHVSIPIRLIQHSRRQPSKGIPFLQRTT